MNQYGRSSQSWSHKKPSGSKKHSKKVLLSKVKAFFASKELWKNIVLAGLIAFFLGTFAFFMLFAWYSRGLPDPDSLIDRNIPLSTKIYDSTGDELLYEISSGEKRSLVTLEQIPDSLQKATITAEDRKFYQHRGVDFKGVARALLTNVMTLDATGQGASTITQQLVKNAILTNEKTIARKVKELLLSLALERRYEKDEILQMYLNEIPYGSTNYGAESAARAYFGKSVSDLTLAESATLAALPQLPTVYLNNPDRLLARRDWILNSMHEQGYISEEERNDAISQETPVKANVSSITAPHYVLWVKEQLVRLFDERTVEEGGLRVITTLDLEKQKAAEEVLEANVAEKGPVYGFNNAGLVSLSPKDGRILAMVGSANYFDDEINGQVNTTLRPLQPGSSFKPIIYAAAFERGYTPNTILWDVTTTFGSDVGPYTPKNFDGRNHGPLTIRTSLQWSLNIPAVKALYLVGLEEGLQFAERLGYTTLSDRSRFGLSLVLGGGEVKPLEHAAAFASFASEGMYHEPYAISQVFDSKGHEIYAFDPSKKEKRVMDENITRMMTNVLTDDAARSAVFGAGGNLTLPGRPVAAKTGTTNDARDGWTAGYTPDIATVVWVGNTNGKAMKNNSGGSSAAAPIWNGYMRKAHEGLPVAQFTPPSIPVTGKPVIDGIMPSETFTIDTASGLLATARTPESFREEKSCGSHHNILTYVDRKDPLGDAPKDPARADAAWQSWEDAVRNYLGLQSQPVENSGSPYQACVKPTEEDNVHIPENEPTVRINTPSRNETVGSNLSVNIDTHIPRGELSRVEYLIDNTVIDVAFSLPSHTVNIPSWVNNGRHSLVVRVYDDVDNMGEARTDIRIEHDTNTSQNSVIITNPFYGQEIIFNESSYGIAVESKGFTPSLLVLETIRVGQAGTYAQQEIQNPNNIANISWGAYPVGSYLLRAYGVDQFGQRSYSSVIPVHVKSEPVPETIIQ